jgi:hypothetical protein
MENFTKELKRIEELAKISLVRDIEIKMLERELKGYIVNKDIVIEILKELTGDLLMIDDHDYPAEPFSEENKE